MDKLSGLNVRADLRRCNAQQPVLPLKEIVLNNNCFFLNHRPRIVRTFKREVKRISQCARLKENPLAFAFMQKLFAIFAEKNENLYMIPRHSQIFR